MLASFGWIGGWRALFHALPADRRSGMRPGDAYTAVARSILHCSEVGSKACSWRSRFRALVEGLARKPGALRNGAPFRDWILPAALERVRRKLADVADGDRQMVNILTTVLSDGLPAVEALVWRRCARVSTPPMSSSISWFGAETPHRCSRSPHRMPPPQKSCFRLHEGNRSATRS